MSTDRTGVVGPTPVPLRLRYTALEACIGMVSGLDPFAPPLPRAQEDDPRAAMEAVIRTALRRPPCVVSFSGGRDSSAVLALAAHVARREGLPLPIPVTNRFPQVEQADEADWQERVIRHLRLDDWVRLEWDEELDLLGPVADDVLRRHGLAYPVNLHFHEPILRHAAGGALLTGVGGDELFGPWLRGTARALVFGRRRPGVRALHQLLGDVAPRPLRVWRQQRRSNVRELAWLRPAAREALARTRAEAAVGTSLRWDDELRRWWSHRYVQSALGSLRALAADHDAVAVSPFTEGRVLAAWAAAQGATAPLGRRRSLHALVGDVLPADVIERRSKAFFDGAFFTSHARAFAQQGPAAGLDEQLVDVGRLHAEWRSGQPHPGSMLLLRVAWAASRRSLVA